MCKARHYQRYCQTAAPCNALRYFINACQYSNQSEDVTLGLLVFTDSNAANYSITSIRIHLQTRK